MQNLYDANYYRNYNGQAYGRTEEWLSFFGAIADNIVNQLNPKTVLDVGCAFGLLVECLRDREVDAYGLDISEYAVSQSRTDIMRYLHVGSVLEPFTRKYELVVSIEVVEHIVEADCDRLIENLCKASDQVLISTIPDDFDDPTHFNVQPPIYWIKKFARCGFEPDLEFDAAFLTPYAILFRRRKSKYTNGVQEIYGAKKLQDLEISRLKHERNLLKEQEALQQTQIEALQEELSEKNQIITLSEDHIKNVEYNLAIETKARIYFENIVTSYQASVWWSIIRPFRIILRAFKLIFPLAPNLILESFEEKSLTIDAQKFKKWAILEIVKEEENKPQISLYGEIRGEKIRLPMIKIRYQNSNVIWLARSKSDVEKFNFSITRGEFTTLKFYHVSHLYAWFNIFRDRWQRGRGLVAATKLGLRTSLSFFQGGIGKTLNEFWPEVSQPDENYERWLDKHDYNKVDNDFRNWFAGIKIKPKISIILPTYNSNLKYLASAVKSVQEQSYANWQLCIVDDGSTDKAV